MAQYIYISHGQYKIIPGKSSGLRSRVGLIGGYIVYERETALNVWEWVSEEIPEVTGNRCRLGVRGGNWVVDYEITATGFAGAEDTDWKNTGEIEYSANEFYWLTRALFLSDGTTANAGTELVNKVTGGTNAVLTDNLISNPGCEDDYLSLYDSNGAVPAVTNERSVAIAPHSGTYSRHIFLNGANTGVRTLNYSTKTGEVITYSFWTYSVAGTGTLRYAIYKGDGSGTIVPQTSVTVQTGVWRQTTATYTETGGGNTAYIAIYCTTATVRDFYLDDFSFTTDAGKVACIMPNVAGMKAIDTSNIFYTADGYSLTRRLRTIEIPEGYNKSVFVNPGSHILFATATLSNSDYCKYINYIDYGNKFYNLIEQEVTIGTGGDYATIALALAGITDANYLNRYKLKLLNNFSITELAEFTITVGDFHRYFDIKDFCYIDGDGHSLTCKIPETATDDNTWKYEPASFNAISGAKDLTITMQNGRYAVHIDSNANINDRQEFFNCVFTNLSTQEVIDYRIANSQVYSGVHPGHIACGHGTYGGQKMYYKECTISGIHGFSLHTAPNQAAVSTLYIHSCDLVSLPIVQTNYNPTGAIMAGLRFIGYTSQQINNAYIYKGTINGGIDWDAWYVEPTATNLYILTDIIVNRYLGTGTFTNIATVGGALRITSATAGTVANIAGTGATALTSATSDYASNYGTGRLEIGEEWEAYNANINMGTRLGDCSGVNKVMTVDVDGVAKTITFNENFSARNNAYCLAFINTALAGSAIASLYQRASENVPIILT